MNFSSLLTTSAVSHQKCNILRSFLDTLAWTKFSCPQKRAKNMMFPVTHRKGASSAFGLNNFFLLVTAPPSDTIHVPIASKSCRWWLPGWWFRCQIFLLSDHSVLMWMSGGKHHSYGALRNPILNHICCLPVLQKEMFSFTAYTIFKKVYRRSNSNISFLVWLSLFVSICAHAHVCQPSVWKAFDLSFPFSF